MLTTKFEPRDDVNRLLHPDEAGIRCIKPVQLCCKTLRSSNSYAGKTRQHRRASICQKSELVTMSAENIQRVPINTRSFR